MKIQEGKGPEMNQYYYSNVGINAITVLLEVSCQMARSGRTRNARYADLHVANWQA
jgi:hypothetical protein